MAQKKGQGSTQNNRDSAGRRLGIAIIILEVNEILKLR